jgi:phosphatidylinositol alpha-1,6-mannosyltransferase
MATANSKATISKAIKLGCHPEKLKLIFFGGVDSNRFNPNNDGNLIREKYQIGNKRMILCTGRFIERKGHQYLIRSMPEILSEIPDTKLVLIGRGPLKDFLERLVMKLGLKSSVIFTDFVPQEELPLFYAAADVFVLPAIVDSKGDTEGGHGIVIIEAMASRKPIVATNVGGIPDIIIPEKTGLLVNQKDSHALAKAIIRVLTDRNLSNKISENGYKLARQDLLWDATARKFTEIYSQVVNTI